MDILTELEICVNNWVSRYASEGITGLATIAGRGHKSRLATVGSQSRV